MAISSTHYVLVRDLFERGLLPQNGALLQIGEANWYDLDPPSMADDIRRLVGDARRRDALLVRLAQAVADKGTYFLFDIARVFYDLFFSPAEMQAVDFEGTPTAHRLDLNGPIALSRRFDVVINHGTAEHIFNIAQVFKTMHDYTVPGGFMMHEGPFTGWIDHGFYNLQPTLFFDLAEYNRYVLLGMFIEDLAAHTIVQIRAREDVYELAKAKQIPDNSVLFAVLVKSAEESPFRMPIQGYYRQSLPDSGMAAWQELR